MMRVTLDAASVGSGDEAALPPVSVRFATGGVTLLATEGGNRPTVLSLVASGRMKLDAGSVTATASGRPLTAAQLQRRVALIDTPLVAEHSPDVSVQTVVREELALAKSRARAPWEERYPAKRTFGSLSGPERLELLIELALRRPEVEALVVTSPERHGGEPATWWHLLREVAARGVAILVVTDHATVAHLERLPQAEAAGDDVPPLFDLPDLTDRPDLTESSRS